MVSKQAKNWSRQQVGDTATAVAVIRDTVTALVIRDTEWVAVIRDIDW